MSLLRNKLHEAVLALAGPESAKTRLHQAWMEHLKELDQDELPDLIKDKYLALRARLTAQHAMKHEDPVTATIRKMSPAEAGQCARDVVQLFVHLISEGAQVQLRLVERQEGESAVAEPVPDFLTHH